MAKYPIYLEISGKKVVVIGAGSVAAGKVKSLCDAGANVTVISRSVTPDFTAMCTDLDFALIEGEYSREYLSSAVMVIAATDDTRLNTAVYSDCNRLGILCNVVDVPELCDFYVPAVVRRGPLQIAIGTDGSSPVFAAKVRERLEGIFTEDHGRFVTSLGDLRGRLLDEVPDYDKRKQIFRLLSSDESFDHFVKHGIDSWRIYAESIVRNETRDET